MHCKLADDRYVSVIVNVLDTLYLLAIAAFLRSIHLHF